MIGSCLNHGCLNMSAVKPSNVKDRLHPPQNIYLLL